MVSRATACEKPQGLTVLEHQNTWEEVSISFAVSTVLGRVFFWKVYVSQNPENPRCTGYSICPPPILPPNGSGVVTVNNLGTQSYPISRGVVFEFSYRFPNAVQFLKETRLSTRSHLDINYLSLDSQKKKLILTEYIHGHIITVPYFEPRDVAEVLL